MSRETVGEKRERQREVIEKDNWRWRKLRKDVVRTYPRVVMVTMVYQKAAGMEVKLVPSTFFSA